MKKLIYIPVIAAILLAACNKYDIQPEQAEGFIKFYSTDLKETGFSVKETADGGYIAVGNTGDAGQRNVYVVKTDKFGNEESWSPKTIGGTGDEIATSIQVVSDGYIILGTSRQDDTSSYRMTLTKIGLQGNDIWETTMDVIEEDVISGNLLVASTGELLATGIRQTATPQYLVAKFSSAGVFERVRTTTPFNTLINTYLLETQDWFVLCGTETESGKNVINIRPYDKSSLGQPGGGYVRADGSLTGSSIQELNDGNLLISGTVRNNSTGLDEIWLHKISVNSTSGALEEVGGWGAAKTFDGAGDALDLEGNEVRVVSDNSYAVIGTRTETGNMDMVLLFTDAGGSETGRKTFGDDGTQEGISLEVTSDGGLILVGNNGAEDNSMIALVKTDEQGKL